MSCLIVVYKVSSGESAHRPRSSIRLSNLHQFSGLYSQITVSIDWRQREQSTSEYHVRSQSGTSRQKIVLQTVAIIPLVQIVHRPKGDALSVHDVVLRTRSLSQCFPPLLHPRFVCPSRAVTAVHSGDIPTGNCPNSLKCL